MEEEEEEELVVIVVVVVAPGSDGFETLALTSLEYTV